jgi:PhoPQ-activated pathogenicity-related protein
VGIVLWSLLGALVEQGAADLYDYARKTEPAFSWQVKKNSTASGDHIFDFKLTSQTWQGIPWRHRMQVYQPLGSVPRPTILLWVTGGSPRADNIAMGMELARKIGAPAVFLYSVPNQPLLEGGLYEDDLIAETFVRYLNNGDENWPLLFPMVKSVIKAMDALQEFGKKEWSTVPARFVVGGASKRGWTAWLTAAADPRVAAIAPAVIDTLNMGEQMAHQVQVLGAYSSRLSPYSDRGLLPIPQTPRGKRLLSMVDPWAYRDRLTMPKLIINGTNDFYWATGALNLYWNGIPNDKWVQYIPNAGHDLRRQDRATGEQLTDLLNGLAAFARHQIAGTPMPRLTWRHEETDGKLRLTIHASSSPTRARLWTARAATPDFRGAKWHDETLAFASGKAVAEVTPPAQGHLAFFGALEYGIGPLLYYLSTQMRVTSG